MHFVVEIFGVVHGQAELHVLAEVDAVEVVVPDAAVRRRHEGAKEQTYSGKNPKEWATSDRQGVCYQLQRQSEEPRNWSVVAAEERGLGQWQW